MKRTLLAALVLGAAYLFLPSNARGQVIPVFNGVTSNSDTTTTKPTGFDPLSGTISCAVRCDGRVWSASTSVATVTFYCRTSSSLSEPWYPCFSVANPDSTGSFSTLANAREYKVAVEGYVSGTISVKFYNSSVR